MLKKYFILAVAIAMAASVASAQSSKATAAFNDAVWCSMTSTTNGAGIQMPSACTDIYTGDTVNTDPSGFFKVMSASIHVSSSQSLFVTPSLVTGLYTNTATKTKPNNTSSTSSNTSTAVATAGVMMRAVLYDSSGNPVEVAYPIADCGNFNTAATFGCGSQGTGSNTEWGVVLDSRVQTLSQTLSNCTVSITGGGSGTCSFDLTTQLILQTASAHSFGLVFANVPAGTYTVKVYAAIDTGAEVPSGNGTAIGSAAVGLGSLQVQAVRLTHDFSF